MTTKTVAIVGASGLIGRALTNHLLRSDQNWTVRGLQRATNAQTTVGVARFETQNIDLLVPSTFDGAIEGCDTLVISVAAPQGQECTIEYQGVLDMARYAETIGVKRIIYISGISTPHASKWFRSGWAKLQTETALLKLAIPVHILRPSWLMESLARTVRNDKVSIIGSGQMPIHWLSASDLSRIVESLVTTPPSASTVWNVLGPAAIPLHVAAQQYADSLGLDGEIKALPLPIARLVSAFVKELRPIVELSRVYQHFDERKVENNLPAKIRPTTTLKDWMSNLAKPDS